jgi:hypothetical protein
MHADGWILTVFWLFSRLWVLSVSWASLVPPAAGTLYRVLREREPLARNYNELNIDNKNTLRELLFFQRIGSI